MGVDIGSKIRKLRELKDFTQARMADELGISQSYYARIEKNKADITFKRIEEIAGILEIDPMQLLAFDSNQYIHNVSHSQVGSGQYIDQRTANENELEWHKEQLKDLKEQIKFLRELIIRK